MRKHVTLIELRPLGGVYRVPLKSVFNKKKLDQTKTWSDVYGKVKCMHCKKHFQEGDVYTVLVIMKKNKLGDETFEYIHKYQHVGCQK
jgi:hypothetical protein